MQQASYNAKCQAGNDAYCSTALKHPGKVAAFVITSLVADAGLPEIPGLLTEFGWRLLSACALNLPCWTLIGAGGAAGANLTNSVVTDYETAYQENTPEALSLGESVRNGATLYKIGALGDSAAPESQYWATENPLLDPEGYAQRYGVPQKVVTNWNFVVSEQLLPGANFITRTAPGIAPNLGGALEVVVEKFGVLIQSFSMP